jgi:hypothetical protein
MAEDLLTWALRLSQERRNTPSSRYFEGNPEYQQFRAALARDDRIEDLCRIWEIGRRDQVDPEYILFPALTRLAELVEPDPYLDLSTHALAEWVGTATCEERYTYLDRAAATAPKDVYVLWEQLRAAAPGGAAEERPILENLRKIAPGDPLVAAAWDDLQAHTRGLSVEIRNRIAQEMPRVASFPATELCGRLRPKRKGETT